MTDGPLLRLLDMVRRELGADDARVEIGGVDPTGPQVVWVRLSECRRVVAWFSKGPSDRDLARDKLNALVEAYSGTAMQPTETRTEVPGALTQALLNEQLGMLAERLDAARSFVIDDASPVIWGSSDPFQRSEAGIERALRTARVEASSKEAGVDLVELLTLGPEKAAHKLAAEDVPRGLKNTILGEINLLQIERIVPEPEGWLALVLAARAVAHLRPVLQVVSPRTRRVVHEEGFGLLAKPFASSYWLVAVFDHAFSELLVEGAMIRVLPRIERLVLALPPLEPPPAKGRVVRLPRPKGT